ncbi:hypothetical protein [Rhodoligotrophos defluvii]|uniref:hypothetical protein n=1 Tax=Rhodoligotrophos defluvii TaxID=2561934 RepID=UPI0010C9F615|nr:hypothetical protein [Rhodoligotrophos defluvii]
MHVIPGLSAVESLAQSDVRTTMPHHESGPARIEPTQPQAGSIPVVGVDDPLLGFLRNLANHLGSCDLNGDGLPFAFTCQGAELLQAVDNAKLDVGDQLAGSPGVVAAEGHGHVLEGLAKDFRRELSSDALHLYRAYWLFCHQRNLPILISAVLFATETGAAPRTANAASPT